MWSMAFYTMPNLALCGIRVWHDCRILINVSILRKSVHKNLGMSTKLMKLFYLSLTAFESWSFSEMEILKSGIESNKIKPILRGKANANSKHLSSTPSTHKWLKFVASVRNKAEKYHILKVSQGRNA